MPYFFSSSFFNLSSNSAFLISNYYLSFETVSFAVSNDLMRSLRAWFSARVLDTWISKISFSFRSSCFFCNNSCTVVVCPEFSVLLYSIVWLSCLKFWVTVTWLRCPEFEFSVYASLPALARVLVLYMPCLIAFLIARLQLNHPLSF